MSRSASDRRTPTGLRDYAIMLLLARLGLRAAEVARLGLDDVDWRRGEVAVLGKGNRAERLPLPAEMGAAIARYLRRGRPATAQGRTVFVRVHAPHRALTTGGVTVVVFDPAQRAGLAAEREQLATDERHELLAVDGPTNLAKGTPTPPPGCRRTSVSGAGSMLQA